MLAGFIQLIHILVCVGLIVIVLLQADKGEGLAGAFGGGASSTVFGERGSGGFMSKLTTTMAVVFMITSLIIAVYVPRWEEASPSAQYSAPSMPMAPAAMPGLPIQVPETGAAQTAAPVAPVAPAAVTAEPVAAPAPIAAPVAAPAPVAGEAPAAGTN
ncbi:MAG TPA: preprotein translocase subunit SecG [Candidatus Rifleibacterium sp.]|mgnify:FL=1|nr:preprotein translocase subunit SecG [Candidatus Rifleibacterium sp.]HPW59798.1 preprotein translocase subunit SecG [Candidatus Rifleibacterium sp.]